MNFVRDGAELFKAALDVETVKQVAFALDHLPPDRAGVRIHAISALKPHLSYSGCIGAIAAQMLGPKAMPVRAVLFDKTPQMNWKLGWHQDRTIVVRARVDVEGYGPWSTKGGLQHVAPPFDILAGMATLRVHLDPVSWDNAPLRIAPGSHRLGRVPADEADRAAERCGTFACHASAGDVWLYATPILHASEAAARPARRRVLQVDYAACKLPSGLEWLGL